MPLAHRHRTERHAGGLGGVVGILYAIGYPLPFPEGNPYTPSPQYQLFIATGSLVQQVTRAVNNTLDNL